MSRPTNRRTITVEVLPREQGVQAPQQLPSLGVLYQEDVSPEYLALKASGAYFRESRRAVENKLHS